MHRSELQHSLVSPDTRRRLVALASRRLGADADAEDCVQEALLLAFRAKERFEGRSTPFAWLCAVVTNACRMHRRSLCGTRRGGQCPHVPVDEVEDHPMLAAPDATEALVRGREAAAAVADELARVSPRDRRLFAQVVFEGRSTREVTARTGLSELAVKSRMFRVRRRLAERLGVTGC